MCANLVGAARKCASDFGSRALRNLKKLRAKFATSTKYMAKRVSKSSGTFAQMQYGEERNSVNFR